MDTFMAQAAPSTENKASLDEVPLVGKTMASGRKEEWYTLSGIPIPSTTSPDISEFELPAPGQPPYTAGSMKTCTGHASGPCDNTPGFRVQKQQMSDSNSSLNGVKWAFRLRLTFPTTWP